MAHRTRSVVVEQLPQKVNARSGRSFFRDLEAGMNVERPAIVLDCSAVADMERSAMHLLLCCLEGAMKRNGDVRLSGLSPRAMLNLELSGVDRLFRIFSTDEEAVASFHRPIAVMPRPVELDRAAESAA